MENPYISILLTITIAFIVTIVMVGISVFLGPKRPSSVKQNIFECGLPPSGAEPRSRFSVKFYVIAILFLLFDIEAVFLYPWAVNFRLLGWFGFIEMLVFIGVLAFGLFYVWKRGALDWED